MSNPKTELVQFLREHDDPRVWEAMADMMRRFLEGESMESIAASYGVDLEEIGDPGEKCDCEKETAPDAANIQSGKGESESPNPLSPPILQNDKEECQG